MLDRRGRLPGRATVFPCSTRRFVMPAASQNLPIRRLTLYKHGVGFVERRGTVEGTAVALAFRADEVNDALKSLLALDRQGGQVRGIHYETPMDREARLAESGIVLGPDHS